MALSRSACLTARSSARAPVAEGQSVLFGQQGNATLKIRGQMHLHPIFPGLPAALRQLREQRLIRSVWTAAVLPSIAFVMACSFCSRPAPPAASLTAAVLREPSRPCPLQRTGKRPAGTAQGRSGATARPACEVAFGAVPNLGGAWAPSPGTERLPDGTRVRSPGYWALIRVQSVKQAAEARHSAGRLSRRASCGDRVEDDAGVGSAVEAGASGRNSQDVLPAASCTQHGPWARPQASATRGHHASKGAETGCHETATPPCDKTEPIVHTGNLRIN